MKRDKAQKSPNDNTQLNSSKGHQRHPRAMIFWLVSLYTANEPFLQHEPKSRQLVTI
jgi:hypothetical protein